MIQKIEETTTLQSLMGNLDKEINELEKSKSPLLWQYYRAIEGVQFPHPIPA